MSRSKCGYPSITHLDLESKRDWSSENNCQWYIEEKVDGSQLSFDYKLRDGVSKNMNATILMREMGITV